MAIPISEYISISNKMLTSAGGAIDFSGLILTSSAMSEWNGEGSDPYETIRTDYAAGKAVSLTRDLVVELFASTTDAYKFAIKYFGNRATVLHFVKKTESTYAASFTKAVETNGFTNFGCFAVVDPSASLDDLADLAAINANYGYRYAFCVGTVKTNAQSYSAKLMGVIGCHLTIGDDVYCSWMPMSFVASLDYNQRAASSTIDYMAFSGNAAVTNAADKHTMDGLRANYLGVVQTHGMQRKFYQTGVNMDGVDLGAYMDACWIQAQIEEGWFGLVGTGVKIPANAGGATTVKAMVIDVAERALDNGCILNDKPLSDSVRSEINMYANNANAADVVSRVGYYIDAQIVTESGSGKYVCQYILIYAKADHIMKVAGTHIIA